MKFLKLGFCCATLVWALGGRDGLCDVYVGLNYTPSSLVRSVGKIDERGMKRGVAEPSVYYREGSWIPGVEIGVEDEGLKIRLKSEWTTFIGEGLRPRGIDHGEDTLNSFDARADIELGEVLVGFCGLRGEKFAVYGCGDVGLALVDFRSSAEMRARLGVRVEGGIRVSISDEVRVVSGVYYGGVAGGERYGGLASRLKRAEGSKGQVIDEVRERVRLDRWGLMLGVQFSL